MKLFPQHPQADAVAWAAAGGQALHIMGVTPGRVYDQNLQRPVATVRAFGQRDVCVCRTGTEHQHAIIKGVPLIKACVETGEARGLFLVDILNADERQAVAS